ncbi:MAG TPA: hypothetical protein VNW15_04030 [Rhizomicrobium sp.]|jgi:hypothetical protein|nr:hypothetical protein [Rhizomicrobium sp.]
MEPLEISLSTFLKISASKARGKVSTVATFTTPGGYDFYKVLKKLAARLARNEISLAQAEQEIAKIKRTPERAHTLEAIQQFQSWLLSNGQKWADPPKGKYVSPSGLLKIRLNPEVAFVNANGGKTALSLWNMAKPALTAGLAAEGIQCLVNEFKPKAYDEIGILHVRKKLTFDMSLVSAGANARLAYDLGIVEEIWKDLHNPAMGIEDTVIHIASLGGIPPSP